MIEAGWFAGAWCRSGISFYVYYDIYGSLLVVKSDLSILSKLYLDEVGYDLTACPVETGGSGTLISRGVDR